MIRTVTIRFQSPLEAREFYQDCVASQCYPWDIDLLKSTIGRRPTNPQGYETWHYTEAAASIIEPWITWITLQGWNITVYPCQ